MSDFVANLSFQARAARRSAKTCAGVLRSSEFSPYHTRMIFVAKKQLFIKTNLLAAACHWANSSSSRPRRGVRSLSSCWSPVVSSRNVLVGFDCSDCKVPIPSCNEFLNISSLLTITRLWFTEVFRCFNHVESMVFRIFTLWYELYLKRYDTLSSFRGTNQPKFGMFPYKWNPWSWRELSKGAGKQRQSDIRIPKIAMKFWPRFCFELDSSGTTLLWRSWMPGRVARSSSYRGCLKHRSHYLKPSWAVMPMSTCLKSNQTADVSQDFSQWVSWVWLSMTQKLLSRFWSWVMTWLWHDLCFCLIMWCSLALILLDFLILKFHEAFKSHLPAVTMLSLIDGSSQSCHSTTKLMNLCKLNIQTWTAHRSQMRTLSWLNIFEPILDRIIPKSVRKKENAKSQPDQWKSGWTRLKKKR